MTVRTSELGERLAVKWSGHVSPRKPDEVVVANHYERDDANWWLDAIADEIEKANFIWSDECVQKDAADWLRGGREQ